MSDRFTSSEWDVVVPAAGGALPRDAAAKRASVWMWVIGGLEIVAFSCIGLAFALFATLSWPEAEAELAKQNQPAELIEMYRSMHPYADTIAIGVVLAGTLPGLAYLVLGFLVRKGRPLAINIASFLVMLQIVVGGLLALPNIIGALTMGNPGGLTMIVLMYGTPIALLIMALRSLWAARGSRTVGDGSDGSGGEGGSGGTSGGWVE